eukprot:6491442-Amphidinium_carterae.2
MTSRGVETSVWNVHRHDNGEELISSVMPARVEWKGHTPEHQKEGTQFCTKKPEWREENNLTKESVRDKKKLSWSGCISLVLQLRPV